MDDLLILGCIILFFALVVVPVLAIVAISRSSTTRDELARLRRRVEELEQRGVVAPAITPAAAAPVQPAETVMESDPDPIPVAAPEPEPEPKPAHVNPWRSHTPQNTASAEKIVERDVPVAAAQPSAFGGVVSSLVRWFMQGNPLAKLGILLLFLGLSFLLRYTVEHSLFPLELRLVAAALFAIVLLAIGWRLRHKQPIYALILQGGATGALYLTVFGAFRLDDAGLCAAGGYLRSKRRTGDSAKSAQSGDAGKPRWLSCPTAAFDGKR